MTTQLLHIITQSPNTILPQGLAIALNQSGHYQASTIAYTDIPKTQSYSHILPVFLWQPSEQQQILESIDTILQTQDNVFIIVQSPISKEQIKSLLALQGKIAITDTAISMEDMQQYIQELFTTNRQWVFSPSIISILMEYILTPMPHLSNKEQQIIDCARKGLSIQQTAQELNISKNTVAVYRSRILKRTDTKFINQLIARYNE